MHLHFTKEVLYINKIIGGFSSPLFFKKNLIMLVFNTISVGRRHTLGTRYYLLDNIVIPCKELRSGYKVKGEFYILISISGSKKRIYNFSTLLSRGVFHLIEGSVIKDFIRYGKYVLSSNTESTLWGKDIEIFEKIKESDSELRYMEDGGLISLDFLREIKKVEIV